MVKEQHKSRNANKQQWNCNKKKGMSKRYVANTLKGAKVGSEILVLGQKVTPWDIESTIYMC
jgi:hypothetical protein